MIRAVSLLTLGLMPSLAAAQTPDCLRFADLASTDLALARILPNRVNFMKVPDCATTGCRERAYVVAGDEVIVTALTGTAACVLYPARKGRDTTGWLPRSALAIVAAPAAPSWTGRWERIEATITITAAPRGRLTVKGDATWGSFDPDRVRRGGVNIGSIEGVAAPTGSTLAFAIGEQGTIPYGRGAACDCAVLMRRLGRWLLIDDNGNCGGHNVSFDGVYERKMR